MISNQWPINATIPNLVGIALHSNALLDMRMVFSVLNVSVTTANSGGDH